MDKPPKFNPYYTHLLPPDNSVQPPANGRYQGKKITLLSNVGCKNPFVNLQIQVACLAFDWIGGHLADFFQTP